MKITVVVGPRSSEKSKKVDELIAGRPALWSGGTISKDDPFWVLDICMRARTAGKKVLVFTEQSEDPIRVIESALLLPSIVDIIFMCRYDGGLGKYKEHIDIVQMPVEKAPQESIKKHKSFEDIVAEIEKFFMGTLVVKELSVEEFQKAKNDVEAFKDRQRAAQNYVRGEVWLRPSTEMFIGIDPASEKPSAPAKPNLYMMGFDGILYSFFREGNALGDCRSCAFKNGDMNCELQGEDCLNYQGCWVLAGKLGGSK